MASPQVAGVVALLYLNPNLPTDLELNNRANYLEQMLYDNCLDAGDSGYDVLYGNGIVNLKYFEIPQV